MLHLLLHTVVFDLKRYSWSSELCYSEERRENNYDITKCEMSAYLSRDQRRTKNLRTWKEFSH